MGAEEGRGCSHSGLAPSTLRAREMELAAIAGSVGLQVPMNPTYHRSHATRTDCLDAFFGGAVTAVTGLARSAAEVGFRWESGMTCVRQGAYVAER